MVRAGLVSATLCYAAATAAAVGGLLRDRRPPLRVLVGCALAGFLLHLAALGRLASVTGRCPATTPFECAALIGWVLVLLYLVLGASFRVSSLGAFVMPLAAIVTGASLLMRTQPVDDPVPGGSRWLGWHASFALLGYAAFVLGFVLGVMYLLQHRQLRRGQAGFAFFQFPALRRLGRAQVVANGIGWAAFTVGLAAGFLWSLEARGEWLVPDPKFLWSAAVWVAYAAVLFVSLRGAWRGCASVVASVVVFVATVLTLPLSNAASTVHRF